MNFKTLFLIFLGFCLLSGCLPRNAVIQSPAQAKRPSNSASKAGIGTSAHGISYIDRYKAIAIQEMNQYGIPASIKLAQALLESGNGQSALAVNANNHFGIKCGGDWSGRRSYHNDDEENECFRVYSRPEESFRDHSEFLLRKRYANLFTLDRNDYKSWAKGLKAAGYATNPRYADLLVDLIERYELYQYDRPESESQKTVRAAVIEKEIVKHEIEDPENQTSKARVAMMIHEVAAGETLFQIATKYGMTIQKIQQMNGLKSETLHVGQLLVIQ